MKVDKEQMPFRFYEPEDGYKVIEAKDEEGKIISKVDVPALYEDYVSEMLNAYKELGGDMEILKKEGFVKEDGSIDMEKIITDCRAYDDKMISDREVEGALKEFKEDEYGLAGFLGRYTSIDKENGISHQEIGKKALENLEGKSQGLDGDAKRISDSNKVLFAHLATTKFLARSTIVTAAQMVADGAMMQIGCSQGKTTVLAYASYINMVKDVKVMNTSSNPGLVLDNFSEFEEPYDVLGVSQDMVAITRDSDDKDMILMRPKLSNGTHINIKIREDGTTVIPGLKVPIEPEEIKKPNENASEEEKIAYEKYSKEKEKYDKAIKEREIFVKKLSKEFGEEFEKLSPEKQNNIVIEYLEKNIFPKEFGVAKTFEEKVGKVLKKPLVMADTMTLMKYDEYVPNYSADDSKETKSICMCDEADCEFLDARPYEVTGKEYSDKVQAKRFEKRKLADSLIVEAMKNEDFDGSMKSLKELAAEKKIPLEFLKDAYDVRSSLTREGEDYVIDEEGKMTTLNSAKRTLEQDTQGHEQAIYAMRANQGKVDKVPKEKEVLDVKYPYQVIGKYDVHSLISGTMEDRGLSAFKDKGKSLYERFSQSRANLFKTMGFRTPVTKDVVVYKTVGPLTREDKGNVLSSKIITTKNSKGILKSRREFSLNEQSWREYIEENKEDLEKTWINSVNTEINRRKKGQPVLVSVPNEAVGKRLGAKEVFTDAHKPSDSMKKNGKMFFSKGNAYFMDDAYGRGYNSKFEGNNGHVLITTLPDNSRNLEQFLFRVARGGDDGSSSMIISPTDPKLVEFLEDLDKKIENNGITKEIEEQYASLFGGKDSEDWNKIKNDPKQLTNQYFSKLMRGKIPIDRLVFDMYPEETIKIMDKMANSNDFSKYTLSKIDNIFESLIYNEKLGENGVKIAEYMEKSFKKVRIKHLKTFEGDVFGKDRKITREIEMESDHIIVEAATNVLMAFIKNGKNITLEMFREMLPAGYDENELESIYNSSIKKVNEKNNIEIKEQDVEESSERKLNNESQVIINSRDEEILEAIDDYELEAEEIVQAANKTKEEKTTQKNQEYDEGPEQ